MKLKIYYIERESKSQCIKYPTLGCSGTKYNIVKGKNFQPKLKFSLNVLLVLGTLPLLPSPNYFAFAVHPAVSYSSCDFVFKL